MKKIIKYFWTGALGVVSLVGAMSFFHESGFVSGFLAVLVWVAFMSAHVSKMGYLKAEAASGLLDVDETATWLARLKHPYHLKALGDPVFVGARPGPRAELLPVTIPPEVFSKNHVSILGASGTGKSKLAAQVLAQLSRHGNAVVVIDPKDDEYLPGILNAQSNTEGRPFVYINLRAATPQYNPFAGCTEEQREQLLQAGLNLDPSGDPAVDFYRGEDRDACAALIRSGASNMVEMLQAGAELGAVTSRVNFWRELQQLARVKAMHTDSGPDLAAAIEAGGVVYIVGDTDDLNVKGAQRMLLARIVQIIKRREREGARQVALFLDEFKYSLSNVALRALGTIRDRRCNLLLAYQSYGDLADCGTLPPVAVLGAARENTTIKFVYKLEDAKTAAEFSQVAGEKRVTVESANKLLDEGREAGTLREANRAAVTVDMLTTNMPKPLAGEASVCWVFGLGPAFALATMHLPVGPAPQVVAAPAIDEPAALPTAQQLI